MSNDSTPQRLAILSPQWGEGAFWLALGVALCHGREDFLSAQKQPLGFREGQRLRFDRTQVVEFVEEDGDNLLLRTRDGATESVPRAWRARLVPDNNSSKKLSYLDFNTLHREVKASPLDELLDVHTCGARHFFRTRVILVSALARSCAMAQAGWIGAQGDNAFALPSATLEKLKSIYDYLIEEKRSGTLDYAPGETLRQVERAYQSAQMPLTGQNARQIASDIAGNLFDALKAMRNRPTYKPAIPLAALLESARREAMAEQSTVASAPALPTTLWDALPWAKIDFEGQVKPLGSQTSSAQAPLLLASDVMAVREYVAGLRPDEPRPLVVFDGSDGFRTRASIWQDVLEQKMPVLLCLNRDDPERAQVRERRFSFWDWSERDFAALCAPTSDSYPVPAFEHIERVLRSSRHHLETTSARDAALEEAATWMFYLADELKSNDSSPALFRLRGALVGVMLAPARRLCPSNPDSTQLWREQVALVRALAGNNRNYLSDEWVRDLEHTLARFESLWENAHRAKTSALGALLSRLARERVKRVHIVGNSNGEPNDLIESAQNMGVQLSLDGSRGRPQWGFAPEATALVVAGWFSDGPMRGWIRGGHAPQTHVVGFDFELEWLRRAGRRWRKEERRNTDEIRVSNEQKRQWLSFGTGNGKESPLPEAVWEQLLAPETPDDSVSDAEPETRDSLPDEHEERRDEANAERRAQTLRLDWGARELDWQRETWAATVAPWRGEAFETGHRLELGGGYTTFVGDSFRLPVVTAIISAQLSSQEGETAPKETTREEERKTWDELAVGDWVVLREERSGDDRDILRTLADAELEHAGFEGGRDLASRWKVALRDWVEECRQRGQSRQSALESLRAHGLNRGVQTVRGWLESEHTIGPRDLEHDIALIARVTAHPDLLGEEKTVVEAVIRVRSAHHRAADLLAQKLKLAINKWKTEGSAAPELDFLAVRVEGLSAIVARVVAIDELPTSVAVSRLNTLLSPAQDGVPDGDDAPHIVPKKQGRRAENEAQKPLATGARDSVVTPVEALVDAWCKLSRAQLNEVLDGLAVPVVDLNPLSAWIEREGADYVRRVGKRREPIWSVCAAQLRRLPPTNALPVEVENWKKQTRELLSAAAFQIAP